MANSSNPTTKKIRSENANKYNNKKIKEGIKKKGSYLVDVELYNQVVDILNQNGIGTFTMSVVFKMLIELNKKYSK